MVINVVDKIRDRRNAHVSMNKVIAIIGDLIRSRQINDRSLFQENLKNTFQDINKKSKVSILSPFTITLGDEFQAVYKNPDRIFYDYWCIVEAIYPVKVRVALGFHELNTKINRLEAIGMDGPAFHEARDGLLSMKKIGSSNMISLFPKEKETKIFSASLELLNVSTLKWHHSTITILIGLMEDRSIKEISNKNNMTVSGIHRNIKRNNIDRILSFQKEFIKSIKQT